MAMKSRYSRWGVLVAASAWLGVQAAGALAQAPAQTRRYQRGRTRGQDPQWCSRAHVTSASAMRRCDRRTPPRAHQF